MKFMMNTLLALAAVMPAGIQASEVVGKSRTYTFSCGYFSNRVSDVELSYLNKNLPWGTIVELIYGFEGDDVRGGGDDVRRVRLEWQQENRLVVAASAPYTWTANLQVPVHYRSSSVYYDTFDFVVRIILPDGRIEFDNGTQSPWGFYKMKLARENGCVDSTRPPPEFEPVDVTTVVRY